MGVATTGACWMDPVLPLQPQSTAVATLMWTSSPLLSCRTGKSPSYVTHAPMVYTFTVAPARGPGDERKRSGDLRRQRATDPRTGGEEATTDTSSSPAEPGIQRSRPQRVSVVAGRRAAA